MLRIIAGEAGGRRLATPDDDSIRPTSSRAREALFSTIGNLTDAIVADAYAGTGALGCEALSRGASHCYFLEQDPEALRLIENNLERVKAEDRGIILEGDVVGSLRMMYDDPDLWLLDPPYDTDLGISTLQAMREAECVTEEALIVLELGHRQSVPEVDGFRTEDVREYGHTKLAYLRRVVDTEPIEPSDQRTDAVD
jgi:16S rRNA (guanine966-N2)-methyltransferase